MLFRMEGGCERERTRVRGGIYSLDGCLDVIFVTYSEISCTVYIVGLDRVHGSVEIWYIYRSSHGSHPDL